MITCWRCHLEQDESPQCVYCGLDFSEHRPSARTSGSPSTKRRVLFGLILAICVALVAASGPVFSAGQPGQKPSNPEGSSSPAQATTDQALRSAAKELSGDVGLVGELTQGSTGGSIIAMVVFSIIGLGYFSYGKKSQQLLMVICGIGLMGYSYFIDGTLPIILIGLALSALPFVLGRK